jgi:hypothetical protein
MPVLANLTLYYAAADILGSVFRISGWKKGEGSLTFVEGTLVMGLVHWTYNLMKHLLEVQKSQIDMVFVQNMTIFFCILSESPPM